MAGVVFNIEIDDVEVQRMLDRLLRVGDAKPMWTEIGSALEDSTRKRFVTETDPDGNQWADLSPTTLARKRTTRKLYESGDLMQSIRFEAGSDFVEIIAGPTEYALTHQLGRADNKFFGKADAPIPARPFIGLSKEDKQEIDDAIFSFLESAING